MKDTPRHIGMRKKLVEEIAHKGIKDQRVLEAIMKVPRHYFMDSGFINFAYKDSAFPIEAGQTISQPYTVAFQTELLNVREGDKVLEIGTGSGYQTAILLELGATVYSIERQKVLYIKANELLKQLGYRPHLFYGDGTEGKQNYGPFDRILITAAASEIPEELKKQLVVDGILVVPVGDRFHQSMVCIVRKGENEYETSEHGYFVFVPLLKGTQ
ncbi:MAG: protein-L-isoaspartate(D-aspartate) O-methyltransferase [Bacteroidia bacterium]|nr:protein-L-isoaspartate(D-aspartate) O-methyltransferase [Bacteroidia bacterium]